jgi:hypothetical protein
MSDSRFPTECFVCGGAIESEDELVVTSAGWEDCEFQAACHRECMLDGAAVS